MSATIQASQTQFDTATIIGGLYGDGIIGLKGAFEREWVRELHEDIERLFEDALKRPGGAVGRGPKRNVPGPGAMDQPWHRDFPAPNETLIGRRLNSLALNLTAVDGYEDVGPFEIAPGTRWDDPAEFEHGMVPPKWLYPRYEAGAQRKMPKMGDISPGSSTRPSPTRCAAISPVGWSTRSSRSCRPTPSKA